MGLTDEMYREEALEVLRKLLGKKGLLALCVIMETMPIYLREQDSGEAVEDLEDTLHAFSLELLPEPPPPKPPAPSPPSSSQTSPNPPHRDMPLDS
jgi:hypothetical protein